MDPQTWEPAGEPEEFVCLLESERLRIWLDPAWDWELSSVPEELEALVTALEQQSPGEALDPDAGALDHLTDIVADLPETAIAADGRLELALFQGTPTTGEAWSVPAKGVLAVHASEWDQDAVVRDVLLAAHALTWEHEQPELEPWAVATLGAAVATAAGSPPEAESVQTWMDAPEADWGPGATEVDSRVTDLFGLWLRHEVGTGALSQIWDAEGDGWARLTTAADRESAELLWRDLMVATLLVDGPAPYRLQLDGLVPPEVPVLSKGAEMSGELDGGGVQWVALGTTSYSHSVSSGIQLSMVWHDLSTDEVYVDVDSVGEGDWQRTLVLTATTGEGLHWSLAGG